MGNDDEKDESEADELRALGFTTVNWEDSGAYRTLFDDYNTPEHFEQLLNVQDLLSTTLPGGDDEAEELVMMLEDLNPKLFDVLGAAVRTLNRAKNSEDFAQVGISARRYIEQLANTLFPPRNELYKGRKVDVAKFRNRIWAFISNVVPAAPEQAKNIEILGKEIDRLIEETNALVHGSPKPQTAAEVFRDLAKITLLLLQLDPTRGRRPYQPFKEKLLEELRATYKQVTGNDISPNVDW
ncbi:hypothetical protein C0557_06295 [Kosakonia sp. MUSA4]|nr:hypothetical protein C0557_06295 [Kosakonia sp. MUSA4]